ncbi:zf-HC2 domain-containing protein [Streptomyces sp. 110]|uniref:Zf-HC2 domain-containing protein n=1 Tax=Streptomyces endocoffeicus TaxID=2898945 RepID=A0ABS1PYB5_9ACTN|nr:zf-HC2 domain-containing protein [Streptomyces endocoffeicus]MBL1117417.1 zf-HC2 domain-containing protein [Streptomyces endocoffeicus]
MTRSGGPSPAEQHLGDRLAALVDGELGHDARERVLAHLATCCKCKAEADAQRRLKNVFAQTAPPAPSEGFLARLQGLPAAGGDDGMGGSPFGGSGVFGPRDLRGGSRDVRELRDVREPEERRERAFAFVPAMPPGTAIAPAASARASRQRGFRIHEVERPAPRRRFAFAAAGAVSLAAFALGAALPLDAAVDPPGSSADGADTAVSPMSADTAVNAGVRERTRQEVGLLATTDTRTVAPSPTATPSPPSLRQPVAALNPLIQPILSVTELLRASNSTPPAPRPTQLEVPSGPASGGSPYLGVSAPPK